MHPRSGLSIEAAREIVDVVGATGGRPRALLDGDGYEDDVDRGRAENRIKGFTVTSIGDQLSDHRVCSIER
ncbi:MAG: hypothetical protein ACKVVP_17615 [Chloroflexota bacterium]